MAFRPITQTQGSFRQADTGRTQRIEQLRATAASSQKEAERSTASRFLGAVPSAIADIFVEPPAKFVASVAETPKTLFTGDVSQKTYNLPIVGNFKSYISEAETLSNEIIQGKAPLWQMALLFGEVGFAALETAEAAKIGLRAAGAVAKGIKTAAPRVARATTGAVKGRIGARKLDDALEIITPKLTPKEQQAAFRAGRGTQTKFKGEVIIRATKREEEIAGAVADVVKKKTTPFKNINRIDNAISDLSNKVDDGLKGTKLPFNDKQLRAKIAVAKEKSRMIFGTDKSIENKYDAVIEEFLRIQQGKPNTAHSLWRSRIQFDKTIKQRLPRIFEKFGRDNVRANAVQDVRRAVNEFISDLAPQGSAYKDLLRKQTLMFDAIEGISTKAPRIGTTRVSRFLAEHPILKRSAVSVGIGLTGGLIGGGVARRLGN